MKELIIDDIKEKLNIEIDKINDFTDGATESLVFSVNDKYLIKTMEKIEFDVQREFLKIYDNDYLQKIVYCNEELLYICFDFIKGSKVTDYSEINVIDQVYEIVNNYKKYDYDGYGYLFEDHKSWKEFLSDEIDYSSKKIPDISRDKVDESINIIGKYEIEKYLIHGDFGTHNFLINNGIIKVIDPMGVVGDPLYDFYFALFSNVSVFSKLDVNIILSFFEKDEQYKRALMIIVFYIRMSRCFVYDRKNFDKYFNYYDKITL